MAGVVVVLMIPCLLTPTASFGQHGFEEENPQIIEVRIENRRFLPHFIRLRVGQLTRLVLYNADAELHAFVPTELLANTNVQVGGNGAPEFNAKGFKRVLVPSKGKAELTFSPKRPGSFAFFCDLPGHVMNGTVVVVENEDKAEVFKKAH